MKVLSLLLVAFFSHALSASMLSNCPANQIRVWTPTTGYTCVQRFQSNPGDCVLCQGGCLPNQQPYPNWFANFPAAIYQPQVLPWWAYQGNLHYPNLHYPGAWQYPGISPGHYPGQGQVHALKPNIYVESVHKEKNFSLGFGTKEELSFLATTPYLDEQNAWKGKIIGKDRFEIEGTFYDYLFYDIRLPKEKMQWQRGLCAIREEAIKWMLKDLTEMKYPAIALQDFEEHWMVKIPDYPYYCIYPQYNQQLDQALPVSISTEHTSFIRSLYVLIPYKDEPDVDQPQAIPFPFQDPAEIRPSTLIQHEIMFREWGVAFLGE